MARKKLDALTEFVKGYGMKGLAYINISPEEERRNAPLPSL